MDGSGRTPNLGDVESLAHSAADWMLANADEGDPSLYRGLAGITLAAKEAHTHFNEPRYGDAVEQGVGALANRATEVDDASLYFGLAGIAATLHRLGRPDAARNALKSVVRLQRRDGRWGPMFELFAGNAGVGLGALHAGDVALAVDAVTPYLSTATPTSYGVNWPVRPTPPRSHHIAHGTLGIVLALATVGQAAARPDLIELAIAGVRDIVGRNEAGPEGFLVPHSDPPHRPDIIERYSLGWCNGPAGDAQAFRLLSQVTADPQWRHLADRCWATITASGLPQRLRPGFWDNSGRCCGTAGVLALACDRIVEQGDDFAFAETLVRDLFTRATVDDAGVRWSNFEHLASPPELAPEPGWAMGNAGIVRELLRYVRLRSGRSPDYAIPWPDHPPTGT